MNTNSEKANAIQQQNFSFVFLLIIKYNNHGVAATRSPNAWWIICPSLTLPAR